MRFFNRASNGAENLVENGLMPEQFLEQPSNRFEQFLDEHADGFCEYHEIYRVIHELVDDISKDEDIRTKVINAARNFDGKIEVVDKNRRRSLDADTAAELYMTNLPLMMVYLAKATNSADSIKDALKVTGNLKTGWELADALTDAIRPTLAMRSTKLSSKFGAADEVTRRIVESFTDKALVDTNILTDAKAFFDQKEHDDDEREVNAGIFRDMLAIDFMDPKMQQIEKLFSALASEDTTCLQEFLDYAEQKGDQSVTWRAGSLALAAATEFGGKATTRKEVLTAVRHRWQESDGRIEEEYSLFKAGYLRTARTNIRKIAGIEGSGRRRGLRFPINEKDFQTVRTAFACIVPAKHQRAAAIPKQNSITSIELMDESATEPLEVIRAAKTAIGFELVTNNGEMDTSIATTYAGNNQALLQDVISMLGEIAKDPYGKGTKKLQSQAKTGVRIGGTNAKLREFSPHTRPGLSLKGGRDSRRTRIVYAVTPHPDDASQKAVAVIDIVRHDDFDNKYK